VVLLLLLVSLFAPRVKLPHDAFEYVVFFDITQSMDVQDYEVDGLPVSRLDYAREAARRALRALPCGSRVGWGAFTEYRSLLLLSPVEVCGNYNDLLASLARIDGRMRWANASEVGKGVYWSARTALAEGSKPDVIFISDGQEAPPQIPGEGFSMPGDVQPGQVRGWIIGAGGDTPQRIPRSDAEGHRVGYWNAGDVIQLRSPDGTSIVGAEHLSALREPHLQALAARVGYFYARLTGPDSIVSAMKDARFVRRESAPVDLYWIPALLAVLLLSLRYRGGASIIVSTHRKGGSHDATRHQRDRDSG
jgi:mxaL protein